MRKLIASCGLLALLSVGVLTGCSSEPAVQVSSADYPVYDTAADLIGKADLIVRGAAVSSKVEKLYPTLSDNPDPAVNPQAGLSDKQKRKFLEDAAVVVTVSKVRVAEVIKGAVAVGDLVEVSQLGGTLGGVRHVEDHTRILPSSGSEFVLFLSAHDKAPFDLLNPEQAMYQVLPTGALAKGNSPLSSRSVKDLRSEVAALQD